MTLQEAIEPVIVSYLDATVLYHSETKEVQIFDSHEQNDYLCAMVRKRIEELLTELSVGIYEKESELSLSCYSEHVADSHQ